MIDLLYNHSQDVYSENGEDSINQAIFDHLNIAGGTVLEIGAWDGFLSSNCANLWSKNDNYNAILVEATSRLNLSMQDQYNNIACFNELVSIDNTLEDIIDKSKFEVSNDNFVLASIDVDGDDINVARSLGKYRPIVIIIEPNGLESGIIELINFADEIGYDFIGMSGYVGKQSGNVYLIRDDFKSKFDVCSKPWQQRGVLLSGGVLY
jgi:hypothetical protein|tara:strand:- start:1789 stop:2412 length:624 start_codon:yes stop_codon:yes gene_type:complete